MPVPIHFLFTWEGALPDQQASQDHQQHYGHGASRILRPVLWCGFSVQTRRGSASPCPAPNISGCESSPPHFLGSISASAHPYTITNPCSKHLTQKLCTHRRICSDHFPVFRIVVLQLYILVFRLQESIPQRRRDQLPQFSMWFYRWIWAQIFLSMYATTVLSYLPWQIWIAVRLHMRLRTFHFFKPDQYLAQSQLHVPIMYVERS